MTSPQLPGGTAVSGLAVYDWASEDGLCGGSPHLHTVCTEAYAVVGGTGSLQLLTRAGFQEIPVREGSVVWFTPGTIHRVVNTDGSLRVLVVMANSGLPEAGDAVLTFPPEIVGDPLAYRAAAAPAPAGGGRPGADAARRRRDLAISGFLRLRRSAQMGDFAPLEMFYRQAAALVREHLTRWQVLVDQGPAAAVRRTKEQLDALATGRIDHLLEAEFRAQQAPDPDERAWGLCGRLSTYHSDTHLADTDHTPT